MSTSKGLPALPHLSSKMSLRSDRSNIGLHKPGTTGRRATFKTRTLLKKRQDFMIIINDQLVTPKLLPLIDAGAKNENLSLSQLEIRSNYEMSFFGNVSTSVMHLTTQSMAATSHQSYASVINKEDFLFDSYSAQTDGLSDTVVDEEGQYIPPIIMPTVLNVTLVETPVVYLLDLRSTTAIKGSEEGDLVEKANEEYDYLTIGKGRNRKTTDAEIQTSLKLLKTRWTIAKRSGRCHEETFASEWDMLDTYGKTEDSLSDIVQPAGKGLIKDEEVVSFDDQMKALLENPKFQESVLIMERVLANNAFNHVQKKFRGLVAQDPFRPDIEFKYNLELLWTFKVPETENFPVTAMQWHPQNNDILAVGYGKFYYSEKKKGLLCCWNVKNPQQPERKYNFEVPVSSLAFSESEPNLLAVGLFDGTVALLDISKKLVEIVLTTRKHVISNYQPVWQMAWFTPDGYKTHDNHVICACQDGKVYSFVTTKTNDLNEIEMMQVFYSESKIKGVYQTKPCPSNEIPLAKAAAALTITRHPIDECIYYIGSSEGSVHKCSKNYQHQHIDVLMCHSGPVYALEFSHYVSKLFLTGGADSCISIWLEDINEPLITMTKTTSPVEGAEWCPANATIIANISENCIFIWDVQRKTYLPANVHVNPNNCRYTNIKFAPSGKNLVVGDIEGNVHVYSLIDMPFPPFYQAKMLEKVMLKNLITRKDLVSRIIKENLFQKQNSDIKCFVNL